MKKNSNLMPSNKSFGYFFSIVFVILALYFYYYFLYNYAIGFSALAVLTLIVTLLAPEKLSLFNWIWFRVGMLLNLIVSPLVMGISFFLLISPLSLFLKLTGRDILKMKHHSKQTYWIESEAKQVNLETLKQQF